MINLYFSIFCVAVRWRCEPVWHQIHHTDSSGQSRRYHTQSQCRTRLCSEIYLRISLLSNSPYQPTHLLFCRQLKSHCWSLLNLTDWVLVCLDRVLLMWLHLSWRVWRKGSHLNPGLDLFAATTAAHAHPSGEASVSPLTSGRFCPSTTVHRQISTTNVCIGFSVGTFSEYLQHELANVQRRSGCVWHRFGVKRSGLGLTICLHFGAWLIWLPSSLIRQLWKDIILIYDPNIVSVIAKYLLPAIIISFKTFSYGCLPTVLFMLFNWDNHVHSLLILELPDI